MRPRTVLLRDHAAAVGLDGKGRSEQCARIVTLRIGENLARGALLHNLAMTHNDDLVGKRAHDAQIVADKQIGEIALLLQLPQ